MAEANPPPNIRLPDSIGQMVGAREYFRQFEYNIFQLWKRSGGPQDAVELIVAQLEEILARLDLIEARLNAIEARLDAIDAEILLIKARLDYLEGSLSVTAIDLTTSGNHTVICTAEVTITLSAEPLDKDVVRIKQTDFEIVIDGGGRNIESNESLTIRGRHTALKTGLDFIYSADLDEWFVI
jgi:hypothetical protein